MRFAQKRTIPYTCSAMGEMRRLITGLTGIFLSRSDRALCAATSAGQCLCLSSEAGGENLELATDNHRRTQTNEKSPGSTDPGDAFHALCAQPRCSLRRQCSGWFYTLGGVDLMKN